MARTVGSAQRRSPWRPGCVQRILIASPHTPSVGQVCRSVLSGTVRSRSLDVLSRRRTIERGGGRSPTTDVSTHGFARCPVVLWVSLSVVVVSRRGRGDWLPV